MSPSTPKELAAFVRDADRVDVPLFGGDLPFGRLTGEIRHDVADGVVSCLAGTPLAVLNAELARHDRWIPYAAVWPEWVDVLGSLILLGLPHAAEARYGTWRDWILGATMVTAEGGIVRSGSRVVKSVAGYDAHKLLVGSRGALLLPVKVVLRTFPKPSASFPPGVHSLGDKVRSILRVEPTDVRAGQSALGADALGCDAATGTFWASRSVQDLPAFPYAWSLDPYRPSIPDGVLALHRRAKAVLDPGGKLAPGAFHNL